MIQKYLYDPENYNGVITDLEPDILECKVKWALGSSTMNKGSEGDEIPVQLFQILKDDAFLFFFNFILFFKLYIIVLVLPNIKMNPPQVYM